jgi:hypothetical protein
LPNLLGIEFPREVGHANLVLFDHLANPDPQLFVVLRLPIGLVKSRGLFFLAKGSTEDVPKDQSRGAAFRSMTVGAEMIIAFG